MNTSLLVLPFDPLMLYQIVNTKFASGTSAPEADHCNCLSLNMMKHQLQKTMTPEHIEKQLEADSLRETNTEIQLEDAADAQATLDSKAVGRLLRKIDMRLIPTLAFLYAIALIDRGNLPNVGVAPPRVASADFSLGSTSRHGRGARNFQRKPIFHSHHDGKFPRSVVDHTC